MTPESGETIGSYCVVRLLGTGGMGAVYEVEHVGLGVRYALKVFTRERGDVETLRRRFCAEGKALARLRHPNLVRVYDFGEDAERGVLYFVMDLVVGPDGAARTLSDVQPGEADEEQLAKWYGQLRLALEYIHSKGVVHRDFKPGNVLIDTQGNAVLGDFGVSRFVDGGLREELGIEATVEMEKSDARTVMGSVMFLAPEVRRGEKATPASDAYALGVTFYRLLTGIWYEPGPVADGFLAEFGDGWSKALRRLLADNPAARLPIPPVEAAASPRSAKRWRYIVILAVVAALVITGVLLCLVGRRDPTPPLPARSRVPRDRDAEVATPVGSRVPRDRGHAGRVPLPETYTFDQFFPLHTQQK